MLTATQFAWGYLIQHGVAGHSPSYYGGYDLVDKRILKEGSKSQPWNANLSKCRQLFMAEIREHGVNWHRTREPDSDYVSQFQGTFCESSNTEYLEGELILNNGLTQHWVAPRLEVTNVFNMMAQIAEYTKQFEEIFGVSSEN